MDWFRDWGKKNSDYIYKPNSHFKNSVFISTAEERAQIIKLESEIKQEHLTLVCQAKVAPHQCQKGLTNSLSALASVLLPGTSSSCSLKTNFTH